MAAPAARLVAMSRHVVRTKYYHLRQHVALAAMDREPLVIDSGDTGGHY